MYAYMAPCVADQLSFLFEILPPQPQNFMFVNRKGYGLNFPNTFL